MSSPLVDFVNHGILPFVGRGEEAERIISFWREGAEAHGLRALLLEGEAGIGKTRLVEESMARIASQEGAAVHVKLFPDATIALAPLLARGIWRSGAGRRLLKREPEGSMPSVAAALRRMSRLRPTLVVVEDIHLLADEPLRELSTLLDLMGEETISLLFPARPIDDRTRGVLERFIVEEIRLRGLEDREIAHLWQHMHEREIDPDILRLLHEATLGNPLAIRSALRGALTSGALAVDPLTGSVRVTIPLASFGATLDRHVRFLAEGMAAHLTREEIDAAEGLACLGEIFARETAGAAIDDASVIESLMFKGIVVTAATAPLPLVGEPSPAPLLAFAHTLFHKQLAGRRQLHPDRIGAILTRGLPLYSLLPLELLAESDAPSSISPTTMRRGIEHAIEGAITLDAGSDWRLGERVWRLADLLVERIEHDLDDDDRRELRARSLHCRIGFLRRRIHEPEYVDRLEQLLRITDPPSTPQLAELRLHGLRRRIWLESNRTASTPSSPWSEIDALVEQHPELALGNAHIFYLRDLANIAAATMNHDVARQIEMRLDHALASSGATEELRRRALAEVASQLLWSFETQEELDDRLRLLAELESIEGANTIALAVWKSFLLESIGHLHDAIARARAILPHLRERGYVQTYLRTRLLSACCELALVEDMNRTEEAIDAIMRQAPEGAREGLAIEGATQRACIMLLRGDAVAALAIASSLPDDRRPLPLKLLAAALDESPRDALLRLNETGALPEPLAVLVESLTRDDAIAANAIGDALAELLHRPVLRASDLLQRRALLELFDRFREDAVIASILDSYDPLLRSALDDMLRWLDERRLHRSIVALLDRFGDRLGDEGGRWRPAKASAMVYDAAEEKGQGLAITMLGAITAGNEGRDPVRLRGKRLRVLLGLLVADRMLKKPFSHYEFRRVVAGGEDDPERARKAMNLAVHRLRDAIGREAIRTDGETPQLDTARVRVDLLEAHRLILEAATAARSDSLARAQRSLERAIGITRDDVPFPGLYDDFFEAAREDFENLLRTTIIDVAERLLREEDAADAAALLRKGFEAMPDDGELAELLRRALIDLGDHIEAERIRMRHDLAARDA